MRIGPAMVGRHDAGGAQRPGAVALPRRPWRWRGPVRSRPGASTDRVACVGLDDPDTRYPDPADAGPAAPPEAGRPEAAGVQPLLDLASRGPRALRAHRPPDVDGLPQPRPCPVDVARLDDAARRPRLHGHVHDRARAVRPLHGQRQRPLVRSAPRRRAGRPGRVLLRRVRPPRDAADLLGRPRRARGRPLQDRLGHGAALRRRRALLPPRLLPPDRSTRTATRSTTTSRSSRATCRSCASGTSRATRCSSRSRCPAAPSWPPSGSRRSVACPLLLLDTDVPDNAEHDRPISHILYVRGREMRLHQELVLGVGGVRALRALGHRARRLAPQRGPLRVHARRAGPRARGVGRPVRGRDGPRAVALGLHDPHAGAGRQRALRRRHGATHRSARRSMAPGSTSSGSSRWASAWTTTRASST